MKCGLTILVILNKCYNKRGMLLITIKSAILRVKVAYFSKNFHLFHILQGNFVDFVSNSIRGCQAVPLPRGIFFWCSRAGEKCAIFYKLSFLPNIFYKEMYHKDGVL